MRNKRRQDKDRGKARPDFSSSSRTYIGDDGEEHRDWVTDPVDEIKSLQDLMFWRMEQRDAGHCLPLGFGSEAHVTKRDTSALIVGPPQGSGKTSGQAIPQIISALGPVFNTSSKWDTFAGTAAPRSLRGDLYVYAPDGEEVPPGAKRVAIDFTRLCDTRDASLSIATAMVLASDGGQKAQVSGNADFFKKESAPCLALFMYYAYLHDLDMTFVQRSLASPPLPPATKVDPDKPVKRQLHMGDMAMNFARLGLMDEARLMKHYIDMTPRQADAMFSTANQAVSAYALDSVRASLHGEQFDFKAFIEGRPDEELPTMLLPDEDGGEPIQLRGAYDTLYILVADPTLVQSLVAAVEHTLRREVVKVRRKWERDYALGEREEMEPLPLTFVLDELATIAPIHDFPEQLALGNQGYLTMGFVQSPSQIRDIWGKERGSSVLTNAQNIILYRGLKEIDDLRAFSEMFGDRWYRSVSSNSGTSASTNFFDPQQNSEGQSVDYRQVRRLPPDLLGQMDPNDPDVVLWIKPDGTYKWIRNLPYYRCTPWVQILTSVVEQIAELPIDDPRRLLPIPRLSNPGSDIEVMAGRWMPRYWEASARLRHTRAATKAAISAAPHAENTVNQSKEQ